MARELLDEKKVRPQDFSPVSLNEFQEEVMWNQRKFEKEEENFLIDTTLLDSLAYAEDTIDYKERLLEVRKHFTKCVYDIIFYVPIEIDIEDDWMRHLDKEFQSLIDERIKFNLHMTKIKFPDMQIYTIKGSVEERIEKVQSILNEN